MLSTQNLERLFKLVRGMAEPEYISEKDELEKAAREYIGAIDDANLRYALFERYINGCPWDRIADKFGCGTADAVRKRCKRHINMTLKQSGK